MKNEFFSFHAIMNLSGKAIKGVICFYEDGITFNNGYNSVYSQQLDWKEIEYSVSDEKVQTFLFFSTSKIAIAIHDKKNTIPKIIIDRNKCDEVIKALETAKTDAKARYEYFLCKELEKQKEIESKRLIEEKITLENEQLRLQEEQKKWETEQRLLEEQKKQEEEQLRLFEEKKRRAALCDIVKLLTQIISVKERIEEQKKWEEEQQRLLEEKKRREALYDIVKLFAQIISVKEKIEEQRKREAEYLHFLEEKKRKEEEQQRLLEEKRRIEAERVRLLQEEKKREEDRLRLIAEQKRKEEERLRLLEIRKRNETRLLQRLEERHRARIKDIRERKITDNPAFVEFQRRANTIVFDFGGQSIYFLYQEVCEFIEKYIRVQERQIANYVLLNEYYCLNNMFSQYDIGNAVCGMLEGIVEKALYYRSYNVLFVCRTMLDALLEYKAIFNSVEYDEVWRAYEYHDEIDLGDYQPRYVHAREVPSDIARIYRDSRDAEYLQEQRYLRQKQKREQLVQEVIEYISAFTRPVGINQIKIEFPQCTRTVIEMVLFSGVIINYGNRFLNGEKLDLTILDKEKIKGSIRNYLRGGKKIYHIHEVFDHIYYEHSYLFSKLYVENEDQLFYVLCYLFRGDFNFSFPYLASANEEIPSPETRLKQFACRSTEVSIEELLQFAKDNYLKLSGILNFFWDIDDEMFVKNREYLIPVEKTGINIKIAKEIEDIIFNELDGNDVTVAIRDLKSIVKFPVIKVPWDEWLIFSVLRKWSSRLSLYTTSRQFRNAIPVVSLSYFVGDTELREIAKRHVGNIANIVTSKIDDLDDLDELIEDEITLEDIDMSVLEEFDEFDDDFFDDSLIDIDEEFE